MTQERVAEIYEEIRKDIMLHLGYAYACSVEDAMDAVQSAVVFLLERPQAYSQLDDDGVERRLRLISTRMVVNTYRGNTRRADNEQRYLKRRDMQG